MKEYYENTMPSGMPKMYTSCHNEIYAEELMLERQYQRQRDIINYFKDMEQFNENVRDDR